MAFKRTFTEPVPKSNEEWLADVGIDGFHDRAQFVGPTAVRAYLRPLTLRQPT